MITLQVSLEERSYPIWIGEDLLQSQTLWQQAVGQSGRIALVTNTTVGPLYAETVCRPLEALGLKVVEIRLPDGEAFKDWQHLNLIFDGLMEHRIERGDSLVALGGGVVGDMAGFAAACYQRGMPFVQVPTTLLAQVDSSVGGKTAINHPRGKNMIGAFYQPRAVMIDLGTLASLAPREFSAGLAEVIKYGCIMDAGFFGWLEQNMDGLMARDLALLSQAVARSCELKAQVVAADEREGGQRAILNFGHTFGHAIEAGMGYGKWLHGEEVGCGMVLASELSAILGGIDRGAADRIRALVGRAGLPIDPPNWPVQEYLAWMAHDKKSKAGQLRYILLRGLGQASIEPVSDDDVSKIIKKAVAFGAGTGAS